jgi:4-hydroxybenzoate polyprenyltransferase
MRALLAFLEGMRPQQWIKNAVILVGVVFAGLAFRPAMLLRSVEATAVFCLLSGAIYLFNDRMDLASDRRHPVKRHRPLASGRLPMGLLQAGLPVLVLAALAWAWLLGRNFLGIAAAFLLINILYSLWMKHQVLLDAFGIALNFVLRAVAGVAVLAEHLVAGFGPEAGEAGSVLLSPWLLVCTFFGSLFLAFAKRRRELLGLEDPGSHRSVLRLYSLDLLDQLVVLSAGAVMLAYVLYTLWPSTVARYGVGFLASNLFVDFGVMRYLFLVYRQDGGADPSEVFLRDRPVAVTVLLWLAYVVGTIGARG